MTTSQNSQQSDMRKRRQLKIDRISRSQVDRMLDRIYENKDMAALDCIKGLILLCYERPQPGSTAIEL